ncbi:MAG TPA: long-chain fatty acid--CoA ligase [Cyclobacteriaceae bacterium]
MEITTHNGADFTRLFDLPDYQIAKYPNPHAFNYFANNKWIPISIQQFKQQANNLSCWFLENGYQRGEKIVLVPFIGSPEWMIIDFACQQAGLITVPIHPNLTDLEVSMILHETESRLCLTTSKNHSRLVKVAKQALGSTSVFQIESKSPNYLPGFSYKASSAQSLELLQNIKNDIHEDDLVTILYTSGSSGEPKGVMLSHRNIIFNIKAMLTLIPLEPEHRVLSFLPFSHILERATTYGYIAFGASIYFSESRESFSRDFKTVRPYFSTCVPRVLEKMYDFLQKQLMTKNAIKRNVIRWAISVGKQYREKLRIGPIYAIKLFFARMLVLRHWYNQLGGKMKYMVVGAAALRPEIGRLLSASGIQVVEGYGLTETAPLISINRFEPGMNRFGTVGVVIPGLEIRLDQPNEAGEAEIMVKGPNVMLGYFQKTELTQSVLSPDGWFRTGDLGQFVENRFLQITDRKKDIFKTSTGKYIAPLPLQNHFARSPFIQRCLILGFQRPFVTALIAPHFEILENWCHQKGIHWTSLEFMIHNIKVIAKYKNEIDQLNRELPNYQQVKGFVLCPREWSAENGEITATMKPVRKVLETNYQVDIEKVYSKTIV